jgi:hypothetical protein
MNPFVSASCSGRKQGHSLLLLAFSLSFALLSDSLHAQEKKKESRDTLKYERQSEKFYDSVYNKFQRRKFTRMIYPIAFRAPSVHSNDPLRTERSETPYLPYAGKVIRSVSVNTLPPFGTSLSDTTWNPDMKAAKALNSAHVTTQNFIVRQELRFKEGDRIDPTVMADNERNIRDLSFIDNVRFVIRESPPGSDTVTIQVLTKDVWSIGLNIRTLTTSELKMSVYDANFLGLGDRISVKISMKTDRAPFFRFDGFDYTYSNISGSFINGYIGFTQDDKGNSNFTTGFYRDFFSAATRWAGSATFSQSNNTDERNDSVTIRSTFQEELVWLGVSYPVKGTKKQTRFILAGSVYNKYFLNRPYVKAQYDPFYFNTTNILTGLSLSWNQYYTTSYVQDFGKPENLPYGRLIQFTAGPSFTEFSQRLYTGLALSAGNLVKKFGYLSGEADVGGFLNGDHFEDGIVTLNLNYLSRLYTTKDKRYKFRAYLNSLYGFGFNRTYNNRDFYDLNTLFSASGLATDTALEGTHSAGIRAGTSLFAPWNWFGFRFAFITYAQVGIISSSTNIWGKGTVYGGFGGGIVIKNDNLVFPPFYITLAVYPGKQPNIQGFRIEMTSIPKIDIPDFIPGYPSVKTLNN